MRFWIEDAFIDEKASKLTLKAIAVYVCLKRHCNKKGEAKIGIRKIAKEIGISKNACQRAIKELQLSLLVGQRVNELSPFGYYTVPSVGTELSHHEGQKELGIIKGMENKKQTLKDLEETRQKMIAKMSM